MIITKSEPFTYDEIEKLRERFGEYIKTVIDIHRNICSAGCDRHVESEQMLLETGSKQRNLWGGGVDVATKTTDCNSFINIRPSQNNTSNEIQDSRVRKTFETLTRFFFQVLYDR